MRYDKDKIKENLTLDDVFSFLADLGGEPIAHDDHIVAKTICHCGQSHKLYYYDNTHLFRCYTDCEEDSFDIFELVRKNKNSKHEAIFRGYDEFGNVLYGDWELYHAIDFVANFFNYEITQDFLEKREELQDWQIFEKYDKISLAELEEKKKVELKIFSQEILKNLPRPIIAPWEAEGIDREVMNDRGICFDPKNYGVVIPHFDINNNLVGIRERTLIDENEKYGKYRPAILNGTMYNHPLSFNLYNLNKSKNAIKAMKKAIVFESEKSCLLFASYFGMENDISVACCGSSLLAYQIQLLLNLGVEEIIIGFDKQFKKAGDKEWEKWTKKLKGFYDKYGAYTQISFLFDNGDLLNYKSSPIDEGKDKFMKLFNERIVL